MSNGINISSSPTSNLQYPISKTLVNSNVPNNKNKSNKMNINSKFHHVAASASNHDGAGASASASTTHANGCSSQKQHSQEHNIQIQILVRLDNCKTHCLNFVSSPSLAPSFKIDNVQIIDRLSNVTGIPSQMLRLYNNYKNEKSLSSLSTTTAKAATATATATQLFLSAYTFFPIRGGKGGFGTLLKGQSKQAGAKRTMDFGACRDLNGRRLRHVNDEIKLRKWRESIQKKMKKSRNSDGSANTNASADANIIDIEEEIEELKTMSGIRNWHLMVPNWSEMGGGSLSSKSKKGIERSLRREVEKIARQAQLEQEEKMKKKSDWDQSILSYAKAGDEHIKSQNAKMTNSILEGLSKRKKRKLGAGMSTTSGTSTSSHDNNVGTGNKIGQTNDHRTDGDGNEYESSLLGVSNICTLSGDVILEDDGKDRSSSSSPTSTGNMIVQSKSEFATSAILLNASLFREKSNMGKGLYYEVTVKTCGIAQLGWATILTSDDGSILPSTGKDGFLPNSDTGDGVGDDQFSYGFDGCRGLVFHNGQEKKIGKQANSSNGKNHSSWKDGDIIGCMYDYGKGSIEYSINGESLGVAFEIEPSDKKSSKRQLLYPVFSLNENEIIELNTGPTFCHCPNDFVGVCSLFGSSSEKTEIDDCIAKPITKDEKIQIEKSENSSRDQPSTLQEDETRTNDQCNNLTKPDEVITEKPIDLENYNSAKELEKLGPDKLKYELYTLGCKCGGSPQERANRLFSLKGLSRDEFPKKIRGKNFVV